MKIEGFGAACGGFLGVLRLRAKTLQNMPIAIDINCRMVSDGYDRHTRRREVSLLERRAIQIESCAKAHRAGGTAILTQILRLEANERQQ